MIKGGWFFTLQANPCSLRYEFIAAWCSRARELRVIGHKVDTLEVLMVITLVSRVAAYAGIPFPCLWSFFLLSRGRITSTAV